MERFGVWVYLLDSHEPRSGRRKQSKIQVLSKLYEKADTRSSSCDFEDGKTRMIRRS